MTASLETGEGRSVLRFERVLNHPRERVWRAVTEPGELAQWFPSEVVYEPRVGAPMQFDFGGAHDIDPWPGEVLEWEPPRVFAFAWAEDELRFELFESGDRTRLVFTHAFVHQPGKPARDAAGWATCLDKLLATLGESPAPEADWSEYHEEHLARFGDLTIDGRPVRLRGPYVEVDGRPAVNVTFDGVPGVLVVRTGRLEDGAPVEVRSGSAEAPGEKVAAGDLNDPLG